MRSHDKSSSPNKCLYLREAVRGTRVTCVSWRVATPTAISGRLQQGTGSNFGSFSVSQCVQSQFRSAVNKHGQAVHHHLILCSVLAAFINSEVAVCYTSCASGDVGSDIIYSLNVA
ncbi:hypothetical protein Y032_0334g2851 [Ancylostoma ceylanicum]|uniref:Uncharacterized protein n=1 Tax=Ancylostoma ceylanicum TaxID=53326 RepID=A0A016RZM9_9BILA|nr:hypothetical protein Y032_0334g2851 [Ancylostoma ceylanicum]